MWTPALKVCKGISDLQPYVHRKVKLRSKLHSARLNDPAAKEQKTVDVDANTLCFLTTVQTAQDQIFIAFAKPPGTLPATVQDLGRSKQGEFYVIVVNWLTFRERFDVDPAAQPPPAR